MKSAQLITICFLHVLTQIESQIQIARCGRLGLKNLIPFLTNSFRAEHYWPWHAAIYHQYNQTEPMYQCGGTLISSRSVLTAGHCASVANVPLKAEQVSVSLGRLNLDTVETSHQSFKASSIVLHPNYNSIDYVNDIAIIRLSAGAIFNNYVQPICLWKSDKTDISEVLGKFGTVVGWGRTENGVRSNVLQQANFPVVDVFTCLKSDGQFYGLFLSQTNFCAGSLNGTTICQGDSGGSITFEENENYYIRGIVSVGQGKPNPITQKVECDATKYVIFTDVAKYLPWIKEKTTFECETKLSCESEPYSGLPITLDTKAEFSSCGQRLPTPMPLMTYSYDAQHWPWHAAIYHRTGNSVRRYECGGTVISSTAILTAAQCVQIDAKNISVSLGRLNLGGNENSEQSFGVAEVIVHPEFNTENYANNIAIIKLSAVATFNHYVRPVCLWKSDTTDLSEVVGQIGTVVGWGIEKAGTLNVLQEVTFPVVSDINCLLSKRKFFEVYLTENSFCAGHRNGSSVCNGDDGGSMTFEKDGIHYIRGIVSVRPGKSNPITQKLECDATQSVIFTDVAKYLPWIKEKTTGLPITLDTKAEFSSCGQRLPTPMPLMTNSYDAQHWPWHAAIYHRTGNSVRRYQCGGTLISSRAILTAALCVQIDAKDISVSLGRLNLGANENSDQSFQVAEVIVHPEFNTENYANNIAIIKLSAVATFNHYVRPVCLWKSDTSDLSDVVGQIGTVVGWGIEKAGTLNVLQEVTFPVVSDINCLPSKRNFFGVYLTENSFCAGHRNGSSVCNGDDGGSMTFEKDGIHYIRGIVSVRPGKSNPITQKVECDATQYVIFTDVAKYLSWIKDNK